MRFVEPCRDFGPLALGGVAVAGDFGAEVREFHRPAGLFGMRQAHLGRRALGVPPDEKTRAF